MLSSMYGWAGSLVDVVSCQTRRVAFVAKQAGVPPGELGFHEWSGSTTGHHRSQIRAYLGFRECSVQDAVLHPGLP